MLLCQLASAFAPCVCLYRCASDVCVTATGWLSTDPLPEFGTLARLLLCPEHKDRKAMLQLSQWMPFNVHPTLLQALASCPHEWMQVSFYMLTQFSCAERNISYMKLLLTRPVDDIEQTSLCCGLFLVYFLALRTAQNKCHLATLY